MHQNMSVGNQNALELEKHKLATINKVLSEVKAPNQFQVPSENLMDLYFNADNFNTRLEYLSNVLTNIGTPAIRQKFSKPDLEKNPFIITILDLISEGNNYTSDLILTRKRHELETSFLQTQNNRDSKNQLQVGELGNLDKDGLISLLAQLRGIDGTLISGPIVAVNKVISDIIPFLEQVRLQNPHVYAALKSLIAFVDYGVVASQILTKVTKRAASINPGASMKSAAQQAGYDVPDNWNLNQEQGKSIGSIIQASSNLTGVISQNLLNNGCMFNVAYFNSILGNISQETLMYANKLIMNQGGMEHIVEETLVQGLGTAYCQVTYFLTQNPTYNNPNLLNTLYTIALIGAVGSHNNPQATLEAIYNTFSLPYSPQNLSNVIFDIGAPYAITMGLSIQNPNLIIGYYRMRYNNSPDYSEFAKRLYVGDNGYGGVVDMSYIMQLKVVHQQGALNIGQVTNEISARIGLISNQQVTQTLVGDIISAASVV